MAASITQALSRSSGRAVEVGQHHLRALFGYAPADRPPDATSRAANQRKLAGHASRHCACTLAVFSTAAHVSISTLMEATVSAAVVTAMALIRIDPASHDVSPQIFCRDGQVHAGQADRAVWR